MKVLLLSTNDVGGAGRVTRNIYEILRNKIYIKYWVKNKLKDNGSLQISNFKFFDLVKQKFNRKISSFGKSNIYSYKSPSIFPTKLNKKINNTNFDIVHLTWINDDFLSIEDIGKINKPIVWSLCDMWPFSGVNHYEDFSEKAFWRNKNFLKSKVDFINKISVYRKKKNWKNSMNIITPNKWLSDCVKDSFVMNECKIKTINWPVIKEKFFPITNKNKIKKKFNLPINKKLVLFSCKNGFKDRRKGGKIFIESLRMNKIDFDIVYLGDKNQEMQKIYSGHTVHMIESFDDDKILNEIYNCVDCTVIPSIIDNSPLTAIESKLSGTPIVVFNSNGLRESVNNYKDGVTALAFDPSSFAGGVDWCLSNKAFIEKNLKTFRANYSTRSIAHQILDYYKEINSKILNN